MPKLEPPSRDYVHGGRHLREDGGRTDPIAGHDDAKAQPLGLSGQGRKQRPRLESRSVSRSAKGNEVVPQPGMLEDRFLVGFEPDLEDLVVGHVGLAGLDAEAHASVGRCHHSPPQGESLRILNESQERGGGGGRGDHDQEWRTQQHRKSSVLSRAIAIAVVSSITKWAEATPRSPLAPSSEDSLTP